MIKNITRYREDEEFVVCLFEILDLKPDEIDNELKKIKKMFKNEWIEMLLVVRNNIKCELWISDAKVKKEDIEFAKKNLVIMLKKQEFNWGVETIRGDGYI